MKRSNLNLSILGALLVLMTMASANAQALRTPANYVPDDEITSAPIENSLWVNRLLVRDNGGVLDQVSSDIKRWEEEEEYERLWNVKRPGTHGTPTTKQKKSYLSRQLLKYADKRLGGEVKTAEKGSALHTVGTVQKALKPSSTVKFSDKFKLKFKARILQGSASVYVVNPYVNNSIDINRKGHTILRMNKTFKPLKLSSDLRVDFHNSSYASSLSRPVAKKVRAIISTHQDLKQAPFENHGDNRLELKYFTAF